jgi:hypothetical protein
MLLLFHFKFKTKLLIEAAEVKHPQTGHTVSSPIKLDVYGLASVVECSIDLSTGVY